MYKTTFISSAILVYGLSLLACFSSQANPEYNPSTPWYLAGRPSGWYYDAFLGLERELAYTGSDQYSSEVGADLRAFYTSQKGHRYFIALGETGAYWQFSDSLILGTILEFESGRENSDDPILREFPTLRDTLQGQFSINQRWDNWGFSVVFQPDILDRGKGPVYFVGLSYDILVFDKLRLSYTMDISFSDAEHINTEVGITPAVAARSGLSTYTADSGYKSTTLSVNAGYRLASQWQLIVNIETEFYGSNMSDSPLISQEGEKFNYELSLGLRYDF